MTNENAEKLSKMLKKNFGEELRNLAELGTSVEAGMFICGGKGIKALEPTKTGKITLGSKEELFSPKGIPEDCGDDFVLGEIHTHVAETRVGEADERSSQLSVKDLFWAHQSGKNFTCAIRKGKMMCADLTKLNQPEYQRTQKENEIAKKLHNVWSEGFSYDRRNQEPPKTWFKKAESVVKAIPQHEIAI